MTHSSRGCLISGFASSTDFWHTHFACSEYEDAIDFDLSGHVVTHGPFSGATDVRVIMRPRTGATLPELTLQSPAT
jgi:hypothetical protein